MEHRICSRFDCFHVSKSFHQERGKSMTTRPPFHEQLRYERELRGWSQADLAEKVGCETKTIGRWENGDSIPRPIYRQSLCEIFGKNAAELGLVKDWGKNPEGADLCGHEEESTPLTASPATDHDAQGAVISSTKQTHQSPTLEQSPRII